MARLNVLKLSHLGFAGARLFTHEGAPAVRISAELALRRTVMACMLWEDQFYEDGVSIAARIAELVPQVKAECVADVAIEARERMKLRHAPLLLVREMARHASHRHLVATTLVRVIQRADELAEFLAIYWKDGRRPLSAQVKKGLAAAFTKFDAYQLAKYNRDGQVKLRDVLFLTHAKPTTAEQALVWHQLVEGRLPPADTWEVRLSAGDQKRETWELLLLEHKLGALALLRNLRNMHAAGVSPEMRRSGRPGSSRPCFRACKASPGLRVIPCCWSMSPDPWRRSSQPGLTCCAWMRPRDSLSCYAKSRNMSACTHLPIGWYRFPRDAALPCGTRSLSANRTAELNWERLSRS
jgi:hypothetical protein